MRRVHHYTSQREGAWRLWVREEIWNRHLWGAVQRRLAAESPTRHPRTVEIRAEETARVFFLKIFYPNSALGSFKDIFRRSKAARALGQTETLAGLGFDVPLAVAAGEERRAHVLRRAFLMTLPVAGCPLPVFLRERCQTPAKGVLVRQKRASITRLAQTVREFHDLGFVHGDLVPGNIFAAPGPDGVMEFIFMDNDRTRRYPAWLPQRLWRRNLVQLNRIPLAGISLQDRMRFFHAYAKRADLGRRERKLVGWLERKTRVRRRQCDAVDVSGSFRRLMRWDETAG